MHKIITKLNLKKATGADNISAKILNSCVLSISGPISNLININFENNLPSGSIGDGI